MGGQLPKPGAAGRGYRHQPAVRVHGKRPDAGGVAFILGADPTYKVIEDGQWLNDTLPYGTLHRLASAGESKGIGKAVVEWCLEHCESLRADTHADNKVMQHLLESEGFTRCGIIHVEDGTPRIAYQRLSLTQSQLG